MVVPCVWLVASPAKPRWPLIELVEMTGPRVSTGSTGELIVGHIEMTGLCAGHAQVWLKSELSNLF